VIASAEDGDLGAILGLGFPPFRGGPFRYVDHEGATVIVERMEALAQRHGPRYEPAAGLRELARTGGCFYPEG
jgi:3-hydroxyacyl-CoA dehydrogenase/enoyl-CoA hydratase/3-hydroxybutyryl-CoA epimerase